MKTPKYPRTPMRNCLYCKHYNAVVNACNAPNAMSIATFNPDLTKDCPLFKWEKSETPEVNDKEFVEKYCVGTKCPYYRQTFNLCTRPSKCPFKEHN